ncbi:hypothetical protein [Mucilaginibacter kameinonensis]|uniref:hypothetical protein n=1 Tax=Mucilaginibacter kameinonensis TaxID=452286 RepID=UPI0013CE7704|nr:hypothetical protein [Mucilaginibacter kameinonensis]
MMKTALKIQEAEADRTSVPILSRLGVGISIQRLFINSFNVDHAGRLIFNYIYNDQLKDNEVLGFKTVKLACTKGLWLAGDANKPTSIFLSFSAMEAIAFAHLNASKFNGFSRCLFIALGVTPSKHQIDLIKQQYKNCKFHTVFSNDLIGKIYDCKASLWLTNKDCSFLLSNDVITVTAVTENEPAKKTVGILRDQFSYFAFHRQFGKRSNIKTHKPSDRKYSSFMSYLAHKNGF